MKMLTPTTREPITVRVARTMTTLAVGAALGLALTLTPLVSDGPYAVAEEPAAAPAGFACNPGNWIDTGRCYEDGTPVIEPCTEPVHLAYLLARFQWLASQGQSPAHTWQLLGYWVETCTAAEPAS